MKPKVFLKTLTLFVGLLLFSLFSYANVSAQDGPKPSSALCDENGFIKNTYCPCAEDTAMASICGIVSNANITKSEPKGSKLFNSNSREVYSVREPIGGVTVSIYENDKDVPTGKPFGNLEKKLGECTTTPNEGKYHCLMRRINPGNMVYVVFSCNGKLADMKIVPSVLDFVGLDADVDCNQGPYTYEPLPDVLTFAERDRFLGCSTAGDSVDPQVGYQEGELLTKMTDIGVKGGDIRFTEFDGWSANLFGGIDALGDAFEVSVGRKREGAYWEKDCLIRYGGDYGPGGYLPEGGGESVDDRNGGLEREYAPRVGGIFQFAFNDVEEKCNYDPDGDGDGAMEDDDEKTAPFRYDIPTLSVEEEQQRAFQTRMQMQREYQDPRAFAQYNHLMLSDCIGEVFLRYYESDDYDTPISCDAIANCTESVNDPYRNTHTTNGLGSRLGTVTDFEEILSGKERDPEDIVCYSDKHGEVKASQIQPPFPDDSCTPGTAGCKYKLSREYNVWQFAIAASNSIKKPRTSETINDSPSRNAARGEPWYASGTEAKQPDLSGHNLLYSDDSVAKNNSGLTSTRIASTQVSEAGGVLANRFVSRVDAIDGIYDYTSERTVWDAGGDIKTICSLSNVNGKLPEIDKENEETFLNDNAFIGNEEDHQTSLTAGHSYHLTEWVLEREAILAEGQLLTNFGMLARDYFDTMHRFAAGEAELLPFTGSISSLWSSIVGRRIANVQKSFAHRTNDLNAPQPAVYETQYEISEENFEELFPAYGEDGYPGDAGGAYPWNDLNEGDYCDVHPGPGMKPKGMRTCKGTCEIVQQKRFCRPFNVAEDGSCTRSSTETIKTPCSATQYESCLTNQLDTGGIDPPKARDLRDGGDVSFGREEIWCNLARAGPMATPGDIKKHDHTARVTQEVFNGGTQLVADMISEGVNYTVRSLTSAIEPQTESHKASFVDYATTNDFPSEGLAAFTGGGFGATHRETAGTNAKGFGTGATVDLLKVVSHPENQGTLVEPFDIPIEFCPTTVKEVNGEENWCWAIEPPTEIIDLDSLDGGPCTPKINSPSCPVAGMVGQKAANILGAAGVQAGNVPGSLLLAAAVSEGGWLLNGSRIRWDDYSIETEYNSGAYWGRFGKCNDGNAAAQGPFGILSYIGFNPGFPRGFEAAVEQGGFHPARVSPDDESIVIASKCNFLDSAYAAAKLLSSYGTAGTCGGGLTESTVRQVMAVYGQGTEGADPAAVDPLWVEVALKCQ